MAYELLRQEVMGLSDESMMQLIAFARFLKQEMNSTVKSDDIIFDVSIQEPSKKKREIGFMADGFISIAPDFDTCLEGMEEYV